jgi:hypothetical protein
VDLRAASYKAGEMEDADEALRAVLQRIDFELGFTGGDTSISQATFAFNVKEVRNA